MIPTKRLWFNVLQTGLVMSGIGWGISFYFTYISWDTAAEQFYWMGAGDLGYRPLLDYWLKMASSVFGCIGIGSMIACIRPNIFSGFILLLGPFHFLIAASLLWAAFRNHLTMDRYPTFAVDITFCFITGALIQLPLVIGYFEKNKARTAVLNGAIPADRE